MSRDSPIAFDFVRFKRVMSSRPCEAIKKAIADPTLPLPIIEIRL